MINFQHIAGYDRIPFVICDQPMATAYRIQMRAVLLLQQIYGPLITKDMRGALLRGI